MSQTIERYMDTTLSAKERAKELLSQMSLQEKMAQTYSIFPWSNDSLENLGEHIDHVSKYGVGGVSTLSFRELKSLEECVEMQTRLQKEIMERSPHHIPAMFHMEGLCGAFIQGATSLPSNMNRASSWDPELEEKLAALVSRQEKALGITQILAPVLDISRDSRMGRQGETYGEDPTLAAAMGTAYTRGIQNDEREDGLKAESVAKHFVGFHNSLGGIHGSESMTPPRLLEEIYGKPFQAAITEAQLRGVMPCYCTFDGEAASSSKRFLTDLLRDKMGLDGLSVSDYSAIENEYNVQGLYESLSEAGLLSMTAGMDMEWPQSAAYNEELMSWFETGKADIQILDTVVQRILEAKFRMGLFEHPFALSMGEVEKAFGRKEDAELVQKSAEESLILLKNDGTLPIQKSVKKIALIGPHAANARSFFGGYTHMSMEEAVHAVANSIAGIGDADKDGKKEVPYIPGTQIQSDETEEFDAVLKQICPDCRSLLEEMKQMGEAEQIEIIYAYGYPVAGNDHSHFSEALEVIVEADLCILTLGGKHGSCSVATMGEGVDGTDINLPECQDAFMVEAARLKKPMIGVHFNGRPISSDIADANLNAIIEAWNPSEGGAKAIVNVLTGAVNPSGKLPLSVAYHAGQIPIYYNHPNGSAYHQGESIGFANYVDLPHTPRYFFGYGLSYTTFFYENLKLSTKEIGPEQTVDVSCEITNTGTCAGTEVVQLYLKDVRATMVRPCMELQGFVRVELAPKETKKVTFTVKASQTAFLDYDLNWMVEKGEIEVLIGASSKDIHLKESFVINDTKYIDGKVRGFYAAVRIE